MNCMTRTVSLAATLILMSMLLGACSTIPKTAADRQALRDEAQFTINEFQRRDPSMTELFETSYGYAVFPTVGKGAIGVGGAYGKGIVYEQGEMIGYCDLSQGTVGVQLGGQSYREVIFFQNMAALDRFTSGEFAFAAQASAVAATSGASADADFNDGVLVFTMAKGGLMYEASIGGQKFSFVQQPQP